MAILTHNVAVDGAWWGPAYNNADQVPAEVATKITNPKAWGGVLPDPSAWDAPTEDAPAADPLQSGGEGGPQEPPAPAATDTPPDFDSMTREQLVAFIEAHPDGTVDNRLGDEKMRATAAALPPVPPVTTEG